MLKRKLEDKLVASCMAEPSINPAAILQEPVITPIQYIFDNVIPVLPAIAVPIAIGLAFAKFFF